MVFAWSIADAPFTILGLLHDFFSPARVDVRFHVRHAHLDGRVQRRERDGCNVQVSKVQLRFPYSVDCSSSSISCC